MPRDQPFALVAKTGSAMRVLAVDAAARRAGLAPGLTLKAARSQVSRLVTAPFDAAADNRALLRLLTLCRRFTPALAAPSADELVLDIGGVGALFGAEAALLEKVRAVFAAEGVALRPGLADTPGLARALARFGENRVAAPGAGKAAIAVLPVEALALSEGDTADLRRLGFRRVGEILARPRALLAEVLGGRLAERLDEMLGLRACPLDPRLETMRIFADRSFLEAVSGAEAILHHVRRMAESIGDQLEQRGRGGRAFRLTLFGARGERRRIAVRGRRPLIDAVAITALFARRFEGLATEASGEDEAFDQMRLEVTRSDPLHARTADLLDNDEGETRFEDFVQSLAARFGRDMVEVIRTDARTAMPEQEAGFAPLGARTIGKGPPGPPPAWGDTILRPLRLFDPPQAIEALAEAPNKPPVTIVWRRLRRHIVKAEGPERMTAEWGRGMRDARTRDYYRLEDSQGRRYWVFRDGLSCETAAPRWYLHGLFA